MTVTCILYTFGLHKSPLTWILSVWNLMVLSIGCHHAQSHLNP